MKYICLQIFICVLIILATSGGWSAWNSWSSCNHDCVRHRRRSCNDPKPSNGGPLCEGQDHDVDVCKGGSCIGKDIRLVL